jgi:hypothetical protein
MSILSGMNTLEEEEKILSLCAHRIREISISSKDVLKSLTIL